MDLRSYSFAKLFRNKSITRGLGNDTNFTLPDFKKLDAMEKRLVAK
jgi:hypothetical protein